MRVGALWKRLLYNKKLLPNRGGSSGLMDGRRVIHEKSNPCKREKSGLLRDSGAGLRQTKSLKEDLYPMALLSRLGLLWALPALL